MSVQLPVRAERNLQVMKVPWSATTVPLSNVGRDGNGRFAHLIRQAELLARGKTFCQLVDQIGEVHGSLPRDEISVTDDISHVWKKRNSRSTKLPEQNQ